MSSEFVKFAAALFAILNPFGNTAIFLSVTAERSAAERRTIALMTAAAVLITLLVAAVVGQEILALFGISIGSFRIAGGVIIMLIALSMLHARPSGVHHSASEESDGQQKDNPAIFPLAIPVIAGPGAMATVILYAEHARGIGGALVIGAVIVLMCLILLITLRAAGRLSSFLGPTGMNVLIRLMGMILAAIAIEMIAGGLTQLFPQLRPAGG
ncbi:MAG TPA: MarC family protein [Alphaproteobacteria bacterium]|nr:MarC family protein [Alphaproteobacteria bacterium]